MESTASSTSRFCFSRSSMVSAVLASLLLALGVQAQETAPSPVSSEAAPSGERGEPDHEVEVHPLVATAAELLRELEGLRAQAGELDDKAKTLAGEDAAVLRKRIASIKLDFLELVGALTENYHQQAREGLDALELRVEVEELLVSLGPSIALHIDQGESDLIALRKKRDEVSKVELVAFEQQIAAQSEWVNTLYRAYLDQVQRMRQLGLDYQPTEARLASMLRQRADQEAGRLDLVVDEITQLKERAGESPESADDQALLSALAARRQIAIDSLSNLSRMMGVLDIDATTYQKLLIARTGEVTTDIFRPEVALGLLQESLQRLREWLSVNGPIWAFKLLFFFLMVGAFYALSRVVRRLMTHSSAISTFGISQLLREMLISVVSNAIVILGVLVGLSQLGLELAPLLAGLGIAGFIIGFALQDSLANFAAGLMILGYRPFDVGDLIEAGGVFGQVSHMSLVSTTILTVDNQTLIVPNGKIWGDVIKNISNQRQRRVDMKFRVSYADDLDHAERLLTQILEEHERVLDDPEPIVRLHELTESAQEFVVRPWVRTEDYWNVYWDVTREVKRRFDAEGLQIPFPHQRVLIEQTGESSASASEAGPTEEP